MDGPIPGQSLTREPKRARYERPPEIADPNEAVEYHLTKIANPEVLDGILHALELGLPVKIMTETMLTLAVANGIHNIDVSLVIADVVQEFIISTALEDGIEFREDFDNTEESDKKKKKRVDILLRKAVNEMKDDDSDEGYEMLQDISEMVSDEMAGDEVEPTAAPEVEEEETTKEKPAGLMSRRQNNVT